MGRDRGIGLRDEISFYGWANIVLNVTAITLKAFLVWLLFQVWADVRQVKERQARHETWQYRQERDRTDAEEEGQEKQDVDRKGLG